MTAKIEQECKQKMETTIALLQREVGGIRTGRASAGLLDSITADYYGTMTPIKQMATVSTPEPRTIVIQPWDISAMPAIEKAIKASDLGITPQNDGKVIRLNLPPLTEERRKEMVKMVRKIGEENKVALRNVRRESMDGVKKSLKNKEISEDDEKKTEARIQKLTDEYTAKVDAIVAHKEKEIMEG
ncbi:MAG: ribosome recycling factor [Nitrospinae bacterium]|nr:ribosome recycling factor [Nitrospinota bacterium]